MKSHWNAGEGYGDGEQLYNNDLVDSVSDVFNSEQLRKLAKFGISESGIRELAQFARNRGVDGEEVLKVIEDEFSDDLTRCRGRRQLL